MKKTTILFLSIVFPCLLFAQTEPVAYRSVATKFEEYYQKNEPDSLYQLFGKTIKASLPPDKASLLINQLKTRFGNLKSLQFSSFQSPVAFYDADFEKGNYIMNISLDDENKLNGFFFRPQPAAEKPVAQGLKQSPVNIDVADAKLSGSLVIPENTVGKIPVVLIIAGSGPTDRDGNSSLGIKANSYFLLANDLGKAGIATLRYDKRGVGKSSYLKPENDLRFDDFVADAVALINMLKADPRFSKIIVLGHSEGSLIGMIAVEKEKVDGYISVAGAGDVINKILAEQYKNQSPEDYKVTLGRLDSLSKGMMVKADISDPLLRPSVQPFMISWMKYNPQTEIKKLKIPVLILQGTMDIQVSVADAGKLKKADPDAKLVLVDGMNHVLKDASTDRAANLETYTQPNLPLDTNFVNAVIGFVKNIR